MMWSDKRRAKWGKWRIPEQTLFIVTALGGGIGTIAGMYTFRHKTKKLKFTIGLPTILILEIILVVYLKFIIQIKKLYIILNIKISSILYTTYFLYFKKLHKKEIEKQINVKKFYQQLIVNNV